MNTWYNINVRDMAQMMAEDASAPELRRFGLLNRKASRRREKADGFRLPRMCFYRDLYRPL